MRIECKWLGRMAYKECWEYQRALFEEMLQRQGEESDFAGYILFVEHPAVYTLGKSGKAQNMLISEEMLTRLGAEFYHIDRGGDITFHGEGQVVCYPILDIAKLGIGLRRYIEVLQQLLAQHFARLLKANLSTKLLCDRGHSLVGKAARVYHRKPLQVGRCVQCQAVHRNKTRGLNPYGANFSPITLGALSIRARYLVTKPHSRSPFKTTTLNTVVGNRSDDALLQNFNVAA